MIDAPQQAQAAARQRTGAAGRQRWWLVACCVALVGLAFASHPGHILADTKIDLAINPAQFLQRALHLWDPAQFGQLQNQAAGYFFPVGPFFVLGKLAALPGWITQRLWISFILLAAFGGMVRLCRALDIGSPASRLVAGLAYALSPIALSLLGYDSAQVLPSAMLPWILIPLVSAVHAGSAAPGRTRARFAAQSAVAVAFCSGINAAATVAVLVPAVVYLLAAPRLAPRWRIMAWWAPAVLLATAWWLGPLVLFARYGVSFLPYTESATTTTSVTGLFNTLRGTEDWLAHLTSDQQPWLPAGYSISTGSLPTILTGLVAGLGLTGLVSRSMPHRRFLAWMLLIGVFVVVSGSVGTFGNPLVKHIDSVFNGPLAPLRNLDKFDPLIRLPIALGLASLLAHGRLVRPAWLPRRVWPSRPRLVLAGVCFAAVGALALPVYIGGLSVPGSFSSVPAYWTGAANWLNRYAGNSAVLEEPGARFGQYTWGSPLDDILQPLFVGDWAASQLGVIGSVGNTRLLESIDQQMSAGQGSAGLTQLLGRMGVKYVLVRNDLLRADLRQAWPARIHDAISESPGIVKVAQFGSLPAGSGQRGNAVSDLDPPYPPVQIYQVDGAAPAAVVQPTADTLRVFGAPEALLTLADQGLLADRPVVLNTDAPQVRAAATVVTDSLRRRVRDFGEIRDDYSPTLTKWQPLTTFEAAADFTEPAWLPYESVARYSGIGSVWASSSDANIDALPSQSGTGLLPFAAVDGNLRTMWESGSKSGPVGQWLRIKFDSVISPGRIRVAFADNPAIGPGVRTVQVRTQAGSLTQQVRATSGYQVLRVPPGTTNWLRIKVLGVRGSSRTRDSQVGIEEISIPGVHASRTIEAPGVRPPGGGDPTAIVLAKAEPQQTGCMLTHARWVCSPSLQTPTEEQYGFDESFSVPRPSSASLAGSAVLTDPALIQRYAYGGQHVAVSATSTYTGDPQDQAYAAFDADARTAWISGASDAKPRLTIAWRGTRLLSSITVQRPAGAADVLPVRIRGSAGQVRSVILSAGRAGRDVVKFAPMATSSLTLAFAADYGYGPVQITDVEIPGVQQLVADPAAQVRLGCGSGPTIEVNGKPVATRASGTVADILDSRPLAFTACSAVREADGTNTVTEAATDEFSAQAVTMIGEGASITAGQARAATTPPASSAKVLTWTSERRVLSVSTRRSSYLIVNENFNAGWQASLHGRELRPVELDGWKQAWLLPAGSRGLVTLTYGPDSQYRIALFGGLAALVLIIAAALVPLRRRSVSARRARGEPSSPPRPVVSPPAASPRRTAVPRPGWIRASWVCLTGALGLWIGGYPGVGLLPILTACFLAAIGHRERSGLARAAASPWLIAALMTVAACCDVLGIGLWTHGVGGLPLTALAGVIPELLCLGVVGRLLAALLVAGSAPTSARTPAD
jgi:arabinofuranan 3-O-arabinosyltransferase